MPAGSPADWPPRASGTGDAVAMLAGAPVEIAPAAQGVWMRGASVTMVHQPTPRTDLVRWAEETTAVITMIDAKAVVISDPFMAAAPVLDRLGMTVLTIAGPARLPPDRPRRHRRRRHRADAVDLRIHRLAQGRADQPRQHRRQRRRDDRRLRLRHRHRRDRQLAALLPRHGHDRLPDRADVLRRRAGQGHPDGLPQRYPVVAQADRQVQGHHDRRAQLRLQPARPAAAPAGHPRRVRPVLAAVGAVGRRAGRPARRRRSLRRGRPVRPRARRPSSPPTAWPRPPSRCRSPNAAAAWSSTRWTPTCWRSCTARYRRPRATPAASSRSASRCTGLELRVVDEDGGELPARGVGVIEVRGEPVTRGYTTVAGFIAAQDERGWYDTGDIGYLTEAGDVVVCGRLKDVIIMAGRNIYPTDIERAAGRVDGVRPGCAVAVRLDAGRSRETFAVAVECKDYRRRRAGAARRTPGRPRGVRRGRRPAPQRGGAGAGHDPEDAVGQAAARACALAGELTASTLHQT